MGIFNLIKRADEPTATPTTADDVLLQALISGRDITVKQALGIPAVASAVERISNMVAILPIKLYKTEVIDGKTKTTELVDDRRVFLLNVDSGDTLNQFNIKRNIARDYLIDKGGFLFIDKRKGEVESLRYVKPDEISATVNDTNPLAKDGKYLVHAKQYELFEFVSVLRSSENGIFGEPVVRQINDILDTALATIIYEMGVAKKGGTKKGFLQSERELSKDAMNALKVAWRNLYSNTNDSVVVLNKGLTFKEASDNSADLQTDQRKKTLHSELSGVFGITSDKFNDFFRDAVLPVLEAFEAALNKTLLLEVEKPNHYFQFYKREVLKAELKQRYEAYKIASEIGVLTKNEIREAENFEAIDGMDVVSMGLGDVIFDTATKEYFTPNTGATKTFGDDSGNETEVINEN